MMYPTPAVDLFQVRIFLAPPYPGRCLLANRDFSGKATQATVGDAHTVLTLLLDRWVTPFRFNRHGHGTALQKNRVVHLAMCLHTFRALVTQDED